MGKIIKVAVEAHRKFKVTGVSCNTDNDTSPVYGDTVTTYRVLFPALPPEVQEEASRAVDGLTANAESEPVKVAPDEPWVDISERRYFDREMTEKAVSLLANAIPGYEFVSAADNYGLHVMTRPNVKICIRSCVESVMFSDGATAPADPFVEPFSYAEKGDLLIYKVTVDRYPAKEHRKIIAQTLHSMDIRNKRIYIRPGEPSPAPDDDRLCDRLARKLTEKISDVAFVADSCPQRYRLSYVLVSPFFRRLFGNKTEYPRLKISDTEK